MLPPAQLLVAPYLFITYASFCPTRSHSLAFLVHSDVISLVYCLIPFFLYMKCADTVVLPLVGKQDLLKPLPNPPTLTFAPCRNIDVPNLVDPNKSRAKIVKPKTTLDEIGPLLHVLDLEGYSESTETSL